MCKQIRIPIAKGFITLKIILIIFPLFPSVPQVYRLIQLCLISCCLYLWNITANNVNREPVEGILHMVKNRADGSKKGSLPLHYTSKKKKHLFKTILYKTKGCIE